MILLILRVCQYLPRMKKKVQGRKGRPSVGKNRTFRCSDRDYERAKMAAEKLGKKLSEYIRDVIVEHSDSVLGDDHRTSP